MASMEPSAHSAVALDPVCGMEVDPEQAAGRSDYGGWIYYFCSPGCKRQFDKNPERYAGGQTTENLEGESHH